MKRSAQQFRSQGPFRADQLRSGDPYELSNGHPIDCMPTGGWGAKAVSVGDGVLASDPAVQDVGVEAGFSPSPEVLRAPDLSVGDIPDSPGWVPGVPPLSVEYADTGQDEADLLIKIRELLAAGPRQFWVVRLSGPRRVEVLTARGLAVDDGLRTALASSADPVALKSVLRHAAIAASTAEVLAALQDEHVGASPSKRGASISKRNEPMSNGGGPLAKDGGTPPKP